MDWYDLLRGLHIIAVIAWMSGMMYLPRLFAYHTETAPPGSEFDAHFKVWEEKLLRIIINPAMILALLLGLALIWYDGKYRLGWSFLTEPWMIVKLAGVVFLGYWHGFPGIPIACCRWKCGAPTGGAAMPTCCSGSICGRWP